MRRDLEMLSLIRRFRSDARGATATEYAMLLVFIALAVALGATALGSGISTLFSNVATQLTGITLNPLPPSP
jgi:pilus assembly protein Flp/PilA